MTPIGSYIACLYIREWHYLRRIRPIRRQDLVGRSVSLGIGFAASKAHSRLSLFLFMNQDVALRYCSSVCLNAAMYRHDNGVTFWNYTQAPN